MYKKPVIIFSILLLFILVAGFLLFFYIKSQKNSENIPNEQESIDIIINTNIKAVEGLKPFVFSDNSPGAIVEEIYRNVNKVSSLKFSPPEKYSQWWISDDGWNISDPNAMVVLIEIPVDDINNYQPNAIHPLAKTLNKKLADIFENSGFQLNATNTSKTEMDDSFFDYVMAFQKDGTRCVLITNNDIEINGAGTKKETNFFPYSVSCSDQFQKAYQEQMPYLKALDDRNSVLNLEKRVGDFVFLAVQYRRMGYFIIGKMEGEKIKIIFAGQEYPPCNLMENNQVPKEVYRDCDQSNYPYKSPLNYQIIWGNQ